MFRPGLFLFGLALVSVLGNRAAVRAQSAPAPATGPSGNKVTIRDDHVMVVNGKPFFPIALYYTEKERADPSGQALKGLRQMGFNSILSYGEPDVDQLDRAVAAGLLVQYGPPGGLHESFDNLRRAVLKIKDHPALLSWYMIDEPAHNHVSFDQVKAGYELLRRLDPHHPVGVCQAGLTITPEEMAHWMKVCDINGFDIYPIPLDRWRDHFAARGWPQSIGVMGHLVGEWKRLVDKPLIVVLQAWSYDPIKYNRGERGFPTPAESRFMAYHCVINGANGINYFGRVGGMPGQVDGDPDRAATDIAKVKALYDWFWARHTPVVQELSAMTPVFTARDAAADVQEKLKQIVRDITPQGALELRIKQVGDVRVVLLVNNSDQNATMTIPAAHFNGVPAYSWLDGRTLQPGTLDVVDEIEPWGVRIYSPATREQVLGNRQPPARKSSLSPGP